jgi:hypothetical protein
MASIAASHHAGKPRLPRLSSKVFLPAAVRRAPCPDCGTVARDRQAAAASENASKSVAFGRQSAYMIDYSLHG